MNVRYLSEWFKLVATCTRYVCVNSFCKNKTIVSPLHDQFGSSEIHRMVRILRKTVMVRVGGGWEPLEVFLSNHDPCRKTGKTNFTILHYLLMHM